MRIHYFQHVAFEGLGMIQFWATKNGYPTQGTAFFEADPVLPDLTSYDALIVMGGPMGVYDGEKHLWLEGEKQHIRKAINAGKPVLGICLGAQLIAASMGARVAPHSQKEIGWFPVAPVDDAAGHPIFEGINPAMDVFHWHGDRFEIPESALHLLSSAACDNQAFIYGDRVLGLQFHLEMDASAINAILQGCADELTDGHWIQTAEGILEKSGSNNTRQVLYRLLDNWIKPTC